MMNMTQANQGHELPEGFTWGKNFLIKCERCKKELDCRTAGERFITKHQDFIEEHQPCVADVGLKPASSLTIRDELASRALSAIVQHEGGGVRPFSSGQAKRALDLANELLAVLYPSKPNRVSA